MLQDPRRWTVSLFVAAVVLVAAALLAGGPGFGTARPVQAAATTYAVQAGDSLFAIAAAFDVSIEDLAAANNLRPGAFLRRGQVLIIPVAEVAPESAATAEATEEPAAAPTAAATEEPAAEATEVAAEEVATQEAMPAAAPAHVSTYTVEGGDTLRGIAATFGVTPDALAAANGLRPDSFLRRGQVLVIPSAEAMSNAVPPTEEPAAETMVEATPEATEEPMAEATAEATVEPTAAPTEEPVAEATAAATEEATAAATEAAVEEATPAPTEAATEEAAAATPAATEEPAAEATAEPAMEATPAPTEEPTAEEQPAAVDLLAAAAATGEHTTLITALEAAGLAAVLKEAGPFTVFAPTDAAFEGLPMGALDALLINPTGDLAQILQYHMTPGLLAAAAITDGLQVATLQGSVLTFSLAGDVLMVNGATVVTAAIPATNGLLYVIDAVLVPSGAAAAPAEAVTVAPPPSDADLDAVAAANAWPAPEGGPEIYSPVADTAYHSPIAITGLAQPGAGDLAVSLTGADGAVLAERTLAVGEAAAFFRTYVRFEITEPTAAVLAVGGQEIAVTLIPGQRFVDVNRPAVGGAACGAVTVNGYSNTFEANVVLALSTRDGQVLEELPATGGSLGVYRDFAATFGFVGDETVALLAAAYETDASGQYAAIDRTVIPVTYYPAGSAACE